MISPIKPDFAPRNDFKGVKGKIYQRKPEGVKNGFYKVLRVEIERIKDEETEKRVHSKCEIDPCGAAGLGEDARKS